MLKCLFTVVFRTFWHIHVKHFALSLVVKGATLLGLKDFILVCWQLLDSLFLFQCNMKQKRFVEFKI